VGVVGQLGRELEARRIGRTGNVVDMAARRRRRWRRWWEDVERLDLQL